MSGSSSVSDPRPDDPGLAWGSPEMWAEIAGMLSGYHGYTFTQKPYRRRSEDWEHDHCIACGQAIAEPGVREDAIAVAYGVGAEHPHGADYEWLCPSCALELAPRLELRLVEG